MPHIMLSTDMSSALILQGCFAIFWPFAYLCGFQNRIIERKEKNLRFDLYCIDSVYSFGGESTFSEYWVSSLWMWHLSIYLGLHFDWCVWVWLWWRHRPMHLGGTEAGPRGAQRHAFQVHQFLYMWKRNRKWHLPRVACNEKGRRK
jgi:hypothetical protein